MPFDSAPQHVSPEIADRLAKMDKVIELLDRPEKWCKGQFRTMGGLRHCIFGALSEVDDIGDLRGLMLPIADALPRKLLWRRKFRRSANGIVHFNDTAETTHADVLRVLRRAREIIAEGRE